MSSHTHACVVMCFCSSAPVGGAVTGHQSSAGSGVHCLGDSYYVTANVGQFEPHDIVVMAYKHNVVIHAQKVCKHKLAKLFFVLMQVLGN